VTPPVACELAALCPATFSHAERYDLDASQALGFETETRREEEERNAEKGEKGEWHRLLAVACGRDVR
jgi:hypothetical protein